MTTMTQHTRCSVHVIHVTRLMYIVPGVGKCRGMYRRHRRRTLYCNDDEENKIARDLESFEN